MPFMYKNHEGITERNSTQNDLSIGKEGLSLEDFFEDDYVYFDEFEEDDRVFDEQEYTDHFIPIAHKLSSDDEIPRKTLADVFPDILQ